MNDSVVALLILYTSRGRSKEKNNWNQWGREYMRRLFKNISLVFDEVLQLLHLTAELLGRCKALCRLHEKCCHLVAAQQTCDTPLESVEHAGLHHS